MTLAEAVSKVLNGMPIHYYMAVDYEGVGNIVDAIGGVWYDVPFHMKYDDTTKGIEDLHIDIPAGRQHLDRENAVEFLRFRKTNDYYKRQGYHGYPDAVSYTHLQKLIHTVWGAGWVLREEE